MTVKGHNFSWTLRSSNDHSLQKKKKCIQKHSLKDSSKSFNPILHSTNLQISTTAIILLNINQISFFPS